MLCTLNFYKYQGQVMWNSTGHGTYRERKEDSFFKILNITGYKNAVVTDTISAFTFVPLV